MHPEPGIIDQESQHTSGCYPKRPLALVRGEGVWVWGQAGRRYLDATSGQGVALIGHAHPTLAAALARQATTLISRPEIFYNDRRAAFLNRLTNLAPPGLTRAFLSNSGSEAVEAALKFARLLTGRPMVVAMQRGFHGRTFGSLSATWEAAYRKPFEPLVPGFRHVPFDNLTALEQALDDSVAAVILEVVQGEGACVRDSGFVARARVMSAAGRHSSSSTKYRPAAGAPGAGLPARPTGWRRISWCWVRGWRGYANRRHPAPRALWPPAPA